MILQSTMHLWKTDSVSKWKHRPANHEASFAFIQCCLFKHSDSTVSRGAHSTHMEMQQCVTLTDVVQWPSATEGQEWPRGKMGLERKWSKTDGEDQPRKAGFGGGRNLQINPSTWGIRALVELAFKGGMKVMEGGLQVFCFLVTEQNCSLRGGCLFHEGRKVQWLCVFL